MTPRLFIATPCYGGNLVVEYVTSLLRLTLDLVAAGTPPHVRFPAGESLVTRARNRTVHEFLKSDCTHLLWIDADLRFRSEDVFALLNSGLDVVGAAYPRKEFNQERISYQASQGSQNILRDAGEVVITDGGGDEKREAKGGFLEVLDLPTGFSLIRREVFERMAAEMPDLLAIDDARDTTHGEPYFAFYDCMIEPGTRRPLSEDYAFCRRWQELGGKCHVYLFAELGHVGRFMYEGRLATDYAIEEKREAAE